LSGVVPFPSDFFPRRTPSLSKSSPFKGTNCFVISFSPLSQLVLLSLPQAIACSSFSTLSPYRVFPFRVSLYDWSIHSPTDPLARGRPLHPRPHNSELPLRQSLDVFVFSSQHLFLLFAVPSSIFPVSFVLSSRLARSSTFPGSLTLASSGSSLAGRLFRVF